MDRITQSLQAYLKSAKIKYQTLFIDVPLKSERVL